MKRLALFLLTNIAVLVTISIVFRLIGLDSIFAKNGVDLDLPKLLVFSAVIGFSGSLISLAMSKFIAIRSTGAQVIEEPKSDAERWLVQTVQHHAQAAGIGMPSVAIFPSDAPNAFATGARRNSALVAVSTGLLQSMKPHEVEAVIGHEVSHVANGDMVTMTLLQGVVNTFVIFLSRVIGFAVDNMLRRDGQRRGPGPGFFIASLVSQILLGILATVIVCWFSRRREFRADAGGARLAGAPNMIGALERLKVANPQPLPGAMKAFGIAGDGAFARLFATHPPLDERIAALKANPA